MNILTQAQLQEKIEQITILAQVNSTIAELEKAISELLNGYQINAQQFHPGINLYRTRICAKPLNISEVKYPPAAYTGIGRANEAGKPIFYGSIGKNVPFFEVGPAIGDTIALTTWRTKAEMILNSVGFTREALKQLGSLRDINTIFDPGKIKAFDKANDIVHEFLANSYVTPVRHNETEKYRLTVAITKVLMTGGPFAGIIYPTVKMFGNADNVALDTNFVDKELELIAIEFVEITKYDADGINFVTETLDSAVSWDDNGNIEWTGKLLGWTLSGAREHHFKFEGTEWVKDACGDQRIDPVLTTVIESNLSAMAIAFKNSYPAVMKLNNQLEVKNKGQSQIIKYAINYDPGKRQKFLTFYLPACVDSISLASKLGNSYEKFMEAEKLFEGEILYSKATSSDGLIPVFKFSDKKEMHFFSEEFIDINQLANSVQAGFDIKMNCNPPMITPPPLNYIFKPKK